MKRIDSDLRILEGEISDTSKKVSEEVTCCSKMPMNTLKER